jgi:uncharacterized protein (TIGR02145 family)
MRKISTTLIAVIFTSVIWAQSPQKMSYQAVIRDADNVLVTNTNVGMQISILQGSATGLAVYVETQTATTNANGLIIIEIRTNSDLSVIDWSNGPYYIKIETDPSGGTSYTITGTTQILSIPYALHARAADTILGSNSFAEVQTLSNVAALGNSVNTQIKNLSEPTDAHDAVTKAYVDALLTRIEELELLSGFFVDPRDNNHYNIVKIGNQVWMAENLKTTKLNTGTKIPMVSDYVSWSYMTTPAYCWFDNDSTTYAQTYGPLYNWYAINTDSLCPAGWHVPSDEEWAELELNLGLSPADIDSMGLRGSNEGSKIAGNNDLWNDGILVNDSGFGETGFMALPAGYRSSAGIFYSVGDFARFWSSTEYDNENALFRYLDNIESKIGRQYSPKMHGRSVRCIKD